MNKITKDIIVIIMLILVSLSVCTFLISLLFLQTNCDLSLSSNQEIIYSQKAEKAYDIKRRVTTTTPRTTTTTTAPETTTLKIEITTGSEKWSGTNDDVYLYLWNNHGKYYKLDTKNHDDYEKGSVKTYTITEKGLTKNMLNNFSIMIKCAFPMGIDFGGSDIPINPVDDWLLYKVKVWFNGEKIYEATPNKWLKKDKDEWMSNYYS